MALTSLQAFQLANNSVFLKTLLANLAYISTQISGEAIPSDILNEDSYRAKRQGGAARILAGIKFDLISTPYLQSFAVSICSYYRADYTLKTEDADGVIWSGVTDQQMQDQVSALFDAVVGLNDFDKAKK